MLEFDIATDVQRLYTDVAIIVKGYREAKPDRNTRNLTRSLANEEILYSQFLLRLSLLSSLEKSGGDNNNNNNNNHNLLQGVETKVGPERSESMRADLEHMESFLRSFKVEISNASRGTVSKVFSSLYVLPVLTW